MSKTRHNLFTLEEQHNHQQLGTWPIADSTLLSTKYKDRFEVAEMLFKTVDRNFFERYNEERNITEWNDPLIPNKSYSHIYTGNAFSYDDDYMSGPISWGEKDDGVKSPEIVQRRKIYFYNWTEEELGSYDTPYWALAPELTYFVEMHKDFKPVLEHYLHENYSDQADQWKELVLYKLMVISYNIPSATEKNRTEHRKHCSERFGDEHCDETLGGLHLGENYSEFWAKNTKTNEKDIITDLAENKMLWMHGEHAEQSGFIPTFHGMIHNSQEDLGVRYSIIMDLQVRYK
jgi:hypothetical protein